MRGSRKITSLARALAPFANRTAGSVVDRIISAAAGAGTFVDANTIHLSGSTILLRHPGAARLAEYPATTEGLAAALAAAVAGDTVLLPGGVIALPVAGGGTYTPGDEISTGQFTALAVAHEISGLTVGEWYAVESYGGSYSKTWIWPDRYTVLEMSADGTNWSGYFGGSGTDGFTGTPHTTAPDFCAHVEVYDYNAGGLTKYHGRAYFKATGTSVWVRTLTGTRWDGSMYWRLRKASVDGYTETLEVPAGVEVVGLGRNTILSGDIVVNGILTNLTVTGTITGAGKLRMVYNASGEQITDLVGFAAADHDHDTAYAAIGHDHTAGDIDSTGASDGQVLTADGLGGAAWETPAGGSVAASAVSVDASGFAGNLSATDTDVQTALETIDAMTAGSALTVEEIDGTPTVSGVTTIKVTNGTLTDDGGGVVTIITGGGAGGGDMNNPMTTAGDIIIGGASGTPVRLGIGTEGQVLTIVSGVPTWADAPTGSGGEAFDTIDPEIQQAFSETFSDSGVPTA